jgi:hypothetical protein
MVGPLDEPYRVDAIARSAELREPRAVDGEESE